MNLALIIPEIEYGGAQRSAQMLGNYYFEKGYKVYYFLLEKGKNVSYEIKGTIIYVDNVTRYVNTVNDLPGLLSTAREIRSLKRKYRIQISLSFMEYSNSLNVLSRYQDKVIVSVRTTLSKRNEYGGILYAPHWIKTIYKLADHIVAVSKYTKRDLINNYGLPENKTVVIPNPSVRQGEEMDDIPWEYGKKAVVCVGRFDPVKQYDRIIRAFSYVYDKDKQTRLILLGDGNIREYLKYICDKQGVSDGVVFVGFTDKLGHFLKNVRAFVMASRAEGFPNAMVEAMAYGVPVITTCSPGGCVEIVSPTKEGMNTDNIEYCEYGVLTPHMSGKASISSALEKNEILLGGAMLKLINDDECYEKYSRKSLRRSGDFDIKKIMRKWDYLFTN